jgi:hypothetical protein
MSDVQERLDRYSATNLRDGGFRPDRNAVSARKHRQRARLSADGLIRLNRTIEAQIIPRLLLAHHNPPPAASATQPIAEAALPHVTAVADRLLADDGESVSARIEEFRAQGHSLETVYLQFLAPVALRLRQLWADDLCGFAEATLALWRLQQIMRTYSVAFRAEAERQETGRRALLLPTPREKYDLSYVMFGLCMRSEFFRRDGWEAWIESDTSSSAFGEVIRNQWFDVVEFVVSGDKQLDALATGIRLIRRQSPNRSIGVMVCGQVFIEHPELVLLVGADRTATDARQGSVQAQNLLGLLASRS